MNYRKQLFNFFLWAITENLCKVKSTFSAVRDQRVSPRLTSGGTVWDGPHVLLVLHWSFRVYRAVLRSLVLAKSVCTSPCLLHLPCVDVLIHPYPQHVPVSLPSFHEQSWKENGNNQSKIRGKKHHQELVTETKIHRKLMSNVIHDKAIMENMFWC